MGGSGGQRVYVYDIIPFQPSCLRVSVIVLVLLQNSFTKGSNLLKMCYPVSRRDGK